MDQARGDRDHAERLLADAPSDPVALQWAVTADFYSALHDLTAHLLAQGVVVSSHYACGQALTSPANNIPLAVVQAYRRPEFRSRDARYNLRIFTARDVRVLMDNDLAAVAAFTGL